VGDMGLITNDRDFKMSMDFKKRHKSDQTATAKRKVPNACFLAPERRNARCDQMAPVGSQGQTARQLEAVRKAVKNNRQIWTQEDTKTAQTETTGKTRGMHISAVFVKGQIVAFCTSQRLVESPFLRKSQWAAKKRSTITHRVIRLKWLNSA